MKSSLIIFVFSLLLGELFSTEDTPLVQLGISENLKDVVCPGGDYSCPDGTTCCPVSGGGYGCCPMPNAVCCSDELHCCPSGTTCDISAGTCNAGKTPISMLIKKRPAKSLSEKSPQSEKPKISEAVVKCPDGEMICPDDFTCCPVLSGRYACCGFPNAVCCADHLHCCPSGYTCDNSTGACNKGNTPSTVLIKKQTMKYFEKSSQQSAQKKQNVHDVVCPGGDYSCPDGTTCCPVSGGGYGCCPMPNAVCCSDDLHCCPSGTTCDTSAGTCNGGDGAPVSLLAKKQPARKIHQSVHEEVVRCPDGEMICPDAMTCCPLNSGRYACCPMPNAVCCADHLHCCPSGSTCDNSTGTCNKGSTPSSVLVKKLPPKPFSKKSSQQSVQKKQNVNDVVCPGGVFSCSDGQTCCLISGNIYGCCPLENAVCCSDHLHCCPGGTTCDTSAGTCNSGNTPVSKFVKKQPAQKISENSVKFVQKDNVKDIVCPGGEYSCPDGMTCCLTSGGEYGCCPYPSAVCCSDQIHCCPGGTTCNLSAGTCDSDNLPISIFVKKHPSTPVSRNKPQQSGDEDRRDNRDNVKSVICPGGQYFCADGQTCCPNLAGTWNCCPYPSAVCCQDHYHCCPYATWCNPTTSTCNRSFIQMLMYPHNGEEAKKIEH